MTAKTLEQEAREAAIDHGEWLEGDADETNADSYVAGYLAAAAARDKEIEALRARVAELEAQIDDYEERMSHVPAGFFA